MKKITVATERTDTYQAIYVDGVLRCQEDTIYFSIVMEFVKDDEPVILSQIEVDIPQYTEWPETLDSLMELQRQLESAEASE